MTPPEQNEYPHGIEICLIGPSGAGKTSLLATLHHTLQEHLPGTFRFDPLRDEQAILLHRKYNELHDVARTPPLVVVRKVHPGSRVTADYAFGLGYQEKGTTPKKITGVTFFDTPGALTESLDAEIKERIRKADVILCAVDASVLMEASPHVAGRHNGSFAIHRLLATNCSAGKKTRATGWCCSR